MKTAVPGMIPDTAVIVLFVGSKYLSADTRRSFRL